MADLERTPSNDPKPTQADSLAAFLADWSEDSVFAPMPEAETETETDHQTPPRRPSSPHHPPAAPDLPSGGALRRRHSSNIVATANSDDGGTNDDRAINSHATISLRLRRSSSTPSLTLHERRQMNQGGPSPSCASAVLHKEFSARSRGGGGGDIRPLPFAARPTEQTQQPSSASNSSSSSSRLTTSLPLSMDHQQDDGASSVRSYSSGNT